MNAILFRTQNANSGNENFLTICCILVHIYVIATSAPGAERCIKISIIRILRFLIKLTPADGYL